MGTASNRSCIRTYVCQKIPAEVKTKFPPIDAKYREEFYPFLNASLQHRDVDLKHVINEAIKVPEIMENNLRYAIEQQEGGIVFLNVILENTSSILRFLSVYEGLDLTFQNAIGEAVKLLNDDSQVPLIISFHAVHCNYEIYALTVSIPVKK